MTMTAAPKRTIRQNIYGNYVGYVGRARTEEFGDHASAENDANEWLQTGTNFMRASCNN